jgi:hypothetical protein
VRVGDHAEGAIRVSDDTHQHGTAAAPVKFVVQVPQGLAAEVRLSPS